MNRRLRIRHVRLVVLLATAVAGCGADRASPSPTDEPPSPPPSSPAAPASAVTDLSVIACAREDPADAGELTGAWRGNDGGTYYIRQLGDCVWWFGTEVDEIEPGATGQRGFANVASGRMVGTQVDLEWADIPLGDVLNAGGLTFVYDRASDALILTQQRGGLQPFGGTVLTRLEPSPAPSASPDASASASAAP